MFVHSGLIDVKVVAFGRDWSGKEIEKILLLFKQLWRFGRFRFGWVVYVNGSW